MPRLNDPSLWRQLIPVPGPDSHKYSRGCAVIFAGGAMTGAARLAADACSRIGAGLCIVVAPDEAGAVYRASLPAHIIVEDFVDVEKHLSDERRNAVLIGPGAGKARAKVLGALRAGKPCVLDADALTAFAGDPDELLGHLHERCILTPHPGEFAKLFPSIEGGDTEKAERAAEKAGCTVLLKGNVSALASRGRETVTNENVPAPYLATAGSGDVLAGMITGLVAQGMEPFDAAAAAIYMHRWIGRRAGAGLVASDLPGMIPDALKEFGGRA